jgi:hypothetical protein
VLRRRGQLWDIGFEGRLETIPHLVGLIFLSHLLRNPRREFTALELLSASAIREPGTTAALTDLSIDAGFGYQAAIDHDARADVQRRITELNSRKSSVGLRPAEDAELNQLRTYLKQATGLRGKARGLSNPSEQARTRISNGLRRALKTIEGRLPLMADHLRKSIQQGNRILYSPPTSVHWNIDLSE